MKKFTMSTTGLVLTIVVIGLALYDLVLVLFSGTGSSISNFLVNVGIKSPVMSFCLGWLCSHFFGGHMHEVKDDMKDKDELNRLRAMNENLLLELNICYAAIEAADKKVSHEPDSK